MKNIIIIAKREFLSQVKKKTFVILTLLAPILIVVFGLVIGMMFKANETEYQITVVDKSGLFQSQMKAPKEITLVYADKSSEKKLREGLPEIEGIDGVLIIPSLSGNNYQKLQQDTELLVNKEIGFESRQKIANAMSSVIRKEKIKKLGLTETQISSLDQSFELKTQNVIDKKQQDDSLAFGIKSVLSGILMYATFMFILIYGVRVMRSVLEEKNNRVVEIIISSVKPFDLMMGKIIGVTLVALTQFIIWIMMVLAVALFFNKDATSFGEQISGSAETLENIDTQIATIAHTLLSLNYGLIIIVFLLFFLLGYLFYSSIYAAIGSAVDNDTETQQFTTVVTLPLMLALYGGFSILNNPEGPTAFWLSIIPLTSPVAMVARIPFGVPLWQIGLSLVLLLASIWGMVYIAAKIYRVGILMYGNKTTFKELWKWIKNN